MSANLPVESSTISQKRSAVGAFQHCLHRSAAVLSRSSNVGWTKLEIQTLSALHPQGRSAVLLFGPRSTCVGRCGWGPAALRSSAGMRRSARSAGFTLVEVMLALAVSAIVLAAIGGVFFSAMRLRERTTALLDESAPMQQALNYLRRDLKGAVGPGGVMESDFRDGDVETAVGQGFGLQFCTTTGIVKDSAPWGDIQEVIYQLKDPTERNNTSSGRDLVRSITRNLLATSAPDYQDQVLLSNVKSVDFFCFDGSQWRDNWDTTMSDTNLPSAVRVRIQMASQTGDYANNTPIEMVVPLMTQPLGTNQSSTATSTTP